MNAKLAYFRDQLLFWRMDALSQRILASIFTVGALTGLTKIVAFAKELVSANQFGTSAEMDAFTSAFTLWSFVIGIVAGALPDALVPVYSKVKTQGRTAADQLAVHSLWIYVAKLILVTLAAALLAPWIIPLYTSNFSPEKQQLTLRFFWFLSPFSLLWGSSLLFTILLQANKKFAAAAAAPAIIPAVAMAFMLLFPRQGIYALMNGTLIGALIQFLLIAFLFFQRHCSISPLTFSRVMTPDMILVLRTMTPYLVSGILMGSTSLINFGMAAWLDEGSVAVLGYGQKLTMIFLTLAVTATSEAFFPYLSDLVAHEKWMQLKETAIRFSALILAGSIPIVGILWLFPTPIVRLVFEHGAFGPEDTERVARLLAWFGLQIPFNLLAVFASRIVCALLASRFMLITTIVNLLANVGANLFFVRILGLQGIALANALVYLLSTVMVYTFLAIELRKRELRAQSCSSPTS